MNSKLLTTLIAVLSASVVLAGCTSGDANPDEGPSGTDGGVIDLGNQGAINGLIVDDNYRPVQLKEDWGSQGPGDYQDIGFVLILETAKRYESNENGEFQVLPLDPGTYTLRVAADNHEAIDKKVQVVAGEYSEVTVEARRQFSTGGSILSQEQTLFVNCAVTTSVIKTVTTLGCGDLSGDSGRYGFSTDFSSFKNDVRGLVTEMYAHQDGYYSNTIRYDACDHAQADGINGCVFADFFLANVRWGKAVLYPDLQLQTGWERNFHEPAEYLEEGEEGYCHPEDQQTSGCIAGDTAGRYFAFEPGVPFMTILFPDHPSKYWQDQVTEAAGQRERWGNGVVMGTRAQYVQTVFLYELPDEGIEDYCVLCEDADIPE